MTVDTNDKICVLFGLRKRYPSIEDLLEKETTVTGTVTVVAAYGPLVRRSMQTSTHF